MRNALINSGLSYYILKDGLFKFLLQKKKKKKKKKNNNNNHVDKVSIYLRVLKIAFPSASATFGKMVAVIVAEFEY